MDTADNYTLMDMDYQFETTVEDRFRRNRYHHHQQQQQQQRPSSPMEGREQQRANNQLEKCGKWLASIPRDDVEVLRQTVEFREFLGAFERLGHAHLRVIVNNNNNNNNNHQGMETKEEQDEDSKGYHASSTIERGKTKAFFVNEKRKRSSTGIPRQNAIKNDLLKRFTSTSSSSSAAAPPPPEPPPSHLTFDSSPYHQSWSDHDLQRKSIAASTMKTSGNTCKGNNHFLRLTDDILLRILEFLRCKCMIQASFTCSRFRELVKKSAIQRTHEISKTRQLQNVMQVLRAKEQICYVTKNDDSQCNVPVPMLLPRRKVLVTNAGDPEYNGIYYCTDCNGNGYVFTKPRFSSPEDYQQTIAEQQPQQHQPQQHQQQQQDRLVLDEANPLRRNNNDNVIGGIQRAGPLPLANHHNGNNDDEDRFQIHRPQHLQQRFERSATAGFIEQEDSFRSGLPLRCVIAKAYSNHEVLWYMSKEIERTKDGSFYTTDGSLNQRPRIYSFYAPLMLSGNAPTELCMYPSQTSALVHQNQAWGSLRGNTDGLEAPTLEVLVGDE